MFSDPHLNVAGTFASPFINSSTSSPSTSASHPHISPHSPSSGPSSKSLPPQSRTDLSVHIPSHPSHYQQRFPSSPTPHTFPSSPSTFATPPSTASSLLQSESSNMAPPHPRSRSRSGTMPANLNAADSLNGTLPMVSTLDAFGYPHLQDQHRENVALYGNGNMLVSEEDGGIYPGQLHPPRIDSYPIPSLSHSPSISPRPSPRLDSRERGGSLPMPRSQGSSRSQPPSPIGLPPPYHQNQQPPVSSPKPHPSGALPQDKSVSAPPRSHSLRHAPSKDSLKRKQQSHLQREVEQVPEVPTLPYDLPAHSRENTAVGRMGPPLGLSPYQQMMMMHRSRPGTIDGGGMQNQIGETYVRDAAGAQFQMVGPQHPPEGMAYQYDQSPPHPSYPLNPSMSPPRSQHFPQPSNGSILSVSSGGAGSNEGSGHNILGLRKKSRSRLRSFSIKGKDKNKEKGTIPNLPSQDQTPALGSGRGLEPRVAAGMAMPTLVSEPSDGREVGDDERRRMRAHIRGEDSLQIRMGYPQSPRFKQMPSPAQSVSHESSDFDDSQPLPSPRSLTTVGLPQPQSSAASVPPLPRDEDLEYQHNSGITAFSTSGLMVPDQTEAGNVAMQLSHSDSPAGRVVEHKLAVPMGDSRRRTRSFDVVAGLTERPRNEERIEIGDIERRQSGEGGPVDWDNSSEKGVTKEEKFITPTRSRSSKFIRRFPSLSASPLSRNRSRSQPTSTAPSPQPDSPPALPSAPLNQSLQTQQEDTSQLSPDQKQGGLARSNSARHSRSWSSSSFSLPKTLPLRIGKGRSPAPTPVRIATDIPPYPLPSPTSPSPTSAATVPRRASLSPDSPSFPHMQSLTEASSRSLKAFSPPPSPSAMANAAPSSLSQIPDLPEPQVDQDPQSDDGAAQETDGQEIVMQQGERRLSTAESIPSPGFLSPTSSNLPKSKVTRPRLRINNESSDFKDEDLGAFVSPNSPRSFSKSLRSPRSPRSPRLKSRPMSRPTSIVSGGSRPTSLISGRPLSPSGRPLSIHSRPSSTYGRPWSTSSRRKSNPSGRTSRTLWRSSGLSLQSATTEGSDIWEDASEGSDNEWDENREEETEQVKERRQSDVSSKGKGDGAPEGTEQSSSNQQDDMDQEDGMKWIGENIQNASVVSSPGSPPSPFRGASATSFSVEVQSGEIVASQAPASSKLGLSPRSLEQRRLSIADSVDSSDYEVLRDDAQADRSPTRKNNGEEEPGFPTPTATPSIASFPDPPSGQSSSHSRTFSVISSSTWGSFPAMAGSLVSPRGSVSGGSVSTSTTTSALSSPWFPQHKLSSMSDGGETDITSPTSRDGVVNEKSMDQIDGDDLSCEDSTVEAAQSEHRHLPPQNNNQFVFHVQEDVAKDEAANANLPLTLASGQQQEESTPPPTPPPKSIQARSASPFSNSSMSHHSSQHSTSSTVASTTISKRMMRLDSISSSSSSSHKDLPHLPPPQEAESLVLRNQQGLFYPHGYRLESRSNASTKSQKSTSSSSRAKSPPVRDTSPSILSNEQQHSWESASISSSRRRKLHLITNDSKSSTSHSLSSPPSATGTSSDSHGSHSGEIFTSFLKGHPDLESSSPVTTIRQPNISNNKPSLNNLRGISPSPSSSAHRNPSMWVDTTNPSPKGSSSMPLPRRSGAEDGPTSSPSPREYKYSSPNLPTSGERIRRYSIAPWDEERTSDVNASTGAASASASAGAAGVGVGVGPAGAVVDFSPVGSPTKDVKFPKSTKRSLPPSPSSKNDNIVISNNNNKNDHINRRMFESTLFLERETIKKSLGNGLMSDQISVLADDDDDGMMMESRPNSLMMSTSGDGHDRGPSSALLLQKVQEEDEELLSLTSTSTHSGENRRRNGSTVQEEGQGTGFGRRSDSSHNGDNDNSSVMMEGRGADSREGEGSSTSIHSGESSSSSTKTKTTTSSLLSPSPIPNVLVSQGSLSNPTAFTGDGRDTRRIERPRPPTTTINRRNTKDLKLVPEALFKSPARSASPIESLSSPPVVTSPGGIVTSPSTLTPGMGTGMGIGFNQRSPNRLPYLTSPSFLEHQQQQRTLNGSSSGGIGGGPGSSVNGGGKGLGGMMKSLRLRSSSGVNRKSTFITEGGGIGSSDILPTGAGIYPEDSSSSYYPEDDRSHGGGTPGYYGRNSPLGFFPSSPSPSSTFPQQSQSQRTHSPTPPTPSSPGSVMTTDKLSIPERGPTPTGSNNSLGDLLKKAQRTEQENFKRVVGRNL